jgi:hypothetical protein
MPGMSRHWIPNPTGKGGFQFRRQDWFIFGVTACCGARTRRTGLPCRAAPVSGSKRCYYHGGMHSGRGHVALPRNLRQGHSKTMALMRKASRAEHEATTLHPDTMKVFRDYAAEIYPSDAEMLILAIDQWVRGEIDGAAFRAVLAVARQYSDRDRVEKPKRRQRKTAPPTPASPTPEPQPEFVELWRTKLSGGW